MSGLLDVNQQSERPADYRGKWFIGEVVANDDSKTGKFGRIKVTVPDLLEGDSSVLPWAIPTVLSGGAGPQQARVDVPLVGSFVYVEFQDGDLHFPMYHGQCASHNTNLDVLATNYPNRQGWHRQGHHWYVDHSDNTVEYLHPTGMKLRVESDGEILIYTPARSTIHTVKDATIQCDANLVVQATGNMRIHAGGTLELSSGGNMTVHSDAHIGATAPGIDLN